MPLLGVYPNNSPLYYKDRYSTMFIDALFILTQNQKQHTCPSTEEWVQKMWFIWNTYNSANKNENIVNFAGKWIQN